jgi:hypothetical protein
VFLRRQPKKIVLLLYGCATVSWWNRDLKPGCSFVRLICYNPHCATAAASIQPLQGTDSSQQYFERDAITLSLFEMRMLMHSKVRNLIKVPLNQRAQI